MEWVIGIEGKQDIVERKRNQKALYINIYSRTHICMKLSKNIIILKNTFSQVNILIDSVFS